MNNTDYRLAYYVKFSVKECFLEPFADIKEEYWTKSTLVKRLNCFKYCIHSARMILVEDLSIRIVSDE